MTNQRRKPIEPTTTSPPPRKLFEHSCLEHPDMTAKQKAFVIAYVGGNPPFNAAGAAKAAGYSAKTAKTQASRLLTDENFIHVAEAVATLAGNLQEDAGLRAQDVLEGLRRIANSNIFKAIQWKEISGEEGPVTSIMLKHPDDIPEELQYAVSEISETRYGLKVKFHDKTTALNLLGRYFALWVDRLRVDDLPDLNLIIKAAPEEGG